MLAPEESTTNSKRFSLLSSRIGYQVYKILTTVLATATIAILLAYILPYILTAI